MQQADFDEAISDFRAALLIDRGSAEAFTTVV
jgi:hypothetical protein